MAQIDPGALDPGQYRHGFAQEMGKMPGGQVYFEIPVTPPPHP
jgi:hypothetical protein